LPFPAHLAFPGTAREKSLMQDAAAFIQKNLRLEAAPDLPEIRLYRAHPKSRLHGRIAGDAPPYWAYHWAGGSALARHILDHQACVKGRHVLDLGTGSGVVAIAAALAGAASVRAVDVDPLAVIAAGLNARANGVAVDFCQGDALDGAHPEAELILIGDLFYETTLASRVIAALDRWGIETLIGDRGRAPLPRSRLAPLAHYAVGDFAQNGVSPAVVYRFRPLA
jgi:predicted nicotinamide N-methyase